MKTVYLHTHRLGWRRRLGLILRALFGLPVVLRLPDPDQPPALPDSPQDPR